MSVDVRRHWPSIDRLIGVQHDDVQVAESGKGPQGRGGAQPLSRVSWLTGLGKRDQHLQSHHRLDRWFERRRVSASTYSRS